MIEALVASAATAVVLAAIVALVVFIAVCNESLTVAFWATVIGFVGFQAVTSLDPVGYVKANPGDLGLIALAFFPVGVIWSFYMWWRQLKDAAASLLSRKAGWREDYYNKTWAEYVEREMPKAADHKSQIVLWIMYWPFSMLSYLVLDILCDIGNWIYTQLSGLYQRLADHVKASLLKD